MRAAGKDDRLIPRIKDTTAQGVVGEEATVNESIIIGLVVGGGVALITGYISHWFRLREMKIQSAEERERLEALWAEEERRRKSDRRREACKGELAMVNQAVDTVMDLMFRAGQWAWLFNTESSHERAEMFRRALRIIDKADLVTMSLEDQEFKNRYDEFMDAFVAWATILDPDTGEPIEGKEKESGRLRTETRRVAAELRRLTREILQED